MAVVTKCDQLREVNHGVPQLVHRLSGNISDNNDLNEAVNGCEVLWIPRVKRQVDRGGDRSALDPQVSYGVRFFGRCKRRGLCGTIRRQRMVLLERGG